MWREFCISRWRRETKIREVNERGIFGEVIYYSPCDKKLRTYPEVEKVTYCAASLYL